VYGSLLVAIGACIGIVIGSVSDTPRVFLERLRGPVETVDLERAAPPAESAEAAPAPPLEAFDELQGAPAKPEPKRTAAVTPPKEPAKPAATPPVASPPPPAAPAKSPEEIVKSLEQKTAAAAAPSAKSQVIQVLSLAERKQADALVAKLKTQGYESYVAPMPDKSGRFRVRVRPGAGQTAAQLEPKLKALGLKTWITAE
jgi:cell division septation protein DedD